MSIPHPIPYQGSKRHLAQTIIGYFPDYAQRLVEPFAGSAAVSLAAAEHIPQVVLNDVNTALIALWREVVDHPDRLTTYYERLWHAQQGRERTFYDAARTRFNKTQRPYYLLYLLARCVKASVRYNAKGEFNQSPDNRRRGRQPQSMRRDIQHASRLLKGKTTFTALDYREVLETVTTQDIVYVDPPYQGVCANRDPRYIEGVKYDEFVDALYSLNRRDIAYILSYDGRTGSKAFGKPLPESLQLTYIELHAGRSSQATLLGRSDYTYESLYISPALTAQRSAASPLFLAATPAQLPLFGEVA